MSRCIRPGRLGPRAPDGAAAATLVDGCALPISVDGDAAVVVTGAVCMSASGPAIGAAKLIGGDCFSGATSLVDVVPGSGDTVFAGTVLMAGVNGDWFKVAVPIAPASLLPKGAGRRTRRCDFRDPADEDFAVGARAFVDELWVCNDVFSRVIAAAGVTVGICISIAIKPAKVMPSSNRCDILALIGFVGKYMVKGPPCCSTALCASHRPHGG